MVVLQPRCDLCSQRFCERDDLIRFLFGNAPNLIVHVAMPFTAAKIQEVDLTKFQTDSVGETLDRSLVLVLSLGLISSGGQSRSR